MEFNVEIRNIETDKTIKRFRTEISTMEELVALYHSYSSSCPVQSCFLIEKGKRKYVLISVCE